MMLSQSARRFVRWASEPVARVKFGLLVALTLAAGCSPSSLEFDEHSEFSLIRVRRNGDVRTLIFVQDDGSEAVETRVNLKRPHELQSNYARYMFASYLLRPHPQHVLIIGLGGGAMVHFLQHHDPQVKVDVVEIDPVVVRVADEYFDVRGGGNVNIITADALDYLRDTDQQYDVIYLDAFLPASTGTDDAGVPLRLKTEQFYRDMQSKLTPGGIVAFNAITHDSFDDDVLAIRNAFHHALLFRVPNSGNRVLIGCTENVPANAVLRSAARSLDGRFDASFSFLDLLDALDDVIP